MAKIFSIISKSIAIVFVIVAAFIGIKLNIFNNNYALAIISIGVFIAGSTIPIDISKIITNLRG